MSSDRKEIKILLFSFLEHNFKKIGKNKVNEWYNIIATYDS